MLVQIPLPYSYSLLNDHFLLIGFPFSWVSQSTDLRSHRSALSEVPVKNTGFSVISLQNHTPGGEAPESVCLFFF